MCDRGCHVPHARVHLLIPFFVKNQPHYVSHIAPIYYDLPRDIRGPFYARGRAASRCEELGIEWAWPPPRWSQQHVIVVAGFEDYRAARPARTIFVNHGSGQTYLETGQSHPAYSGGSNRERAVLFIEPSERAASISRAAYPDIPAIACGVPYLDRYLNNIVSYDKELVAISFHSDVHTAPESRSAFPHYRKAIIELVRSERFKILGHSHPRAHHTMQQFWGSLGVEYEPDWWKVLDRAGVYITDVSSTLFEFAALDRPVVVLDAPWYRRNVHHGLRFWECADIGYRVSEPEDLEAALRAAMRDNGIARMERHKLVQRAYDGGVLDGRATQRAVNAILELASGLAT